MTSKPRQPAASTLPVPWTETILREQLTQWLVAENCSGTEATGVIHACTVSIDRQTRTLTTLAIREWRTVRSLLAQVLKRLASER